MKLLPHLCLVALATCLANEPARAQTIFGAVEPNDTKDQATPALGVAPGDSLEVFYGCPPRLDPEIFRMRTAPLAPAIYRHRLVPISPVAGCFPTILGRSQFNGTIDIDSTVIVQEAVDTTSPSRFLQWYGFGASEEMYVDLDDTSTCRIALTMTLESQPVTPTAIPNSQPPGSFLPISVTPASGTYDIDLGVFDGDFDALPETGRRRGVFSGEPEGFLTANAGTYYIAVSQGPMHLHLPGELQDDYNSDDVIDFRGGVLSGRHDVGASFELLVGGQSVQGSFTEPYEIVWFSFDVGAPEAASTFCPGDGTSGSCPCGESPVGQGTGCLNSTGRGAHLFIDGFFSSTQMRLQFDDLPPGTNYLPFISPGVQAGVPVFGGRLCLGPGGTRLLPAQADAYGRATYLAGNQLPNASYTIGMTFFAQAVYRDNAAGGTCSVNVTNGESAMILY